ncbi:MAG: hypothetical protein O7E52_27085 [Candidatus Poribacteria bacterium]|nr:hypothetical protein [Candidatus Poribacteria bacterium]
MNATHNPQMPKVNSPASHSEIRIRGEDTADGLRIWAKEEIKNAPARVYELGRFLFTASIGGIGVMATLAKLNTKAAAAGISMDALLMVSLAAFGLSMLFALLMAIPKQWKLDGDTDLLAQHKTLIARGQLWTVIWCLVWLTGVLFGLVSVFR